MSRLRINMVKSRLKKAVAAYRGGDKSAARVILALLISTDTVSKALRKSLTHTALACLHCEVYDNAPEGKPPYNELYTRREDAITQFADLAVNHFHKEKRKRAPVAVDGLVSCDECQGTGCTPQGIRDCEPCGGKGFRPVRAMEASPPRSFPVTDPELDAPDGAVVGGFERSGDRWNPIREKRKWPNEVAVPVTGEVAPTAADVAAAASTPSSTPSTTAPKTSAVKNTRARTAAAKAKPAAPTADSFNLYPPTEKPCDAEGIMYHDRTFEPEE